MYNSFIYEKHKDKTFDKDHNKINDIDGILYRNKLDNILIYSHKQVTLVKQLPIQETFPYKCVILQRSVTSFI